MTTPKAEKVRTIVVPSVVALELRRHLRDHQDDGFLFRGRRCTEKMRRIQFYKSAWHPALVGAGLDEDRLRSGEPRPAGERTYRPGRRQVLVLEGEPRTLLDHSASGAAGLGRFGPLTLGREEHVDRLLGAGGVTVPGQPWSHNRSKGPVASVSPSWLVYARTGRNARSMS